MRTLTTTRLSAAILALSAVGCTSAPPARLDPVLGSEAATIRHVIVSALELDAAHDPAADTLFTPNATIVANARLRSTFPRFAGVGRTGRTEVLQTDVEVASNGVGWVIAGYRWVDPAQRLSEAGRATFILRKRAGGWKIIHAHSSQFLPWP